MRWKEYFLLDFFPSIPQVRGEVIHFESYLGSNCTVSKLRHQKRSGQFFILLYWFYSEDWLSHQRARRFASKMPVKLECMVYKLRHIIHKKRKATCLVSACTGKSYVKLQQLLAIQHHFHRLKQLWPLFIAN